VTGYGRHSAAARRPSTHPCAGAAAGGAAFQAGPALTAPCETLEDVREISRQLMRANEANPDPNTAVVTAAAVTLALLARERFGIGQAVYVNMVAANLYANADDALAYAGKPDRAVIDDELHGPAALYRLYRAGEGWLFLAAPSDGEWARVTEVVGRPDLLADPRFASADGRAVHDAELTAELADSLGKRSASDWEARFIAARVAGVRADAATPGPYFAHDPQVLANRFAPETTHIRFGPYRRWGPVVRVDGGPAVLGPGVLAGEQTDEILAALGRSPDAIAALRTAGVVASEPVEWS
jgi:crotonobetainyl-CoA:carnitine CoA-transferase CaiB-like acyl-CoA transferase